MLKIVLSFIRIKYVLLQAIYLLLFIIILMFSFFDVNILILVKAMADP